MGLFKYNGGGDWYVNLIVLFNFVVFCNVQLGMDFDMEYEEVEVGSVELYNFVFVYMMGYGNVVFLDVEVENLCNYLLGGGFFYIDDNYGMDFYVWVVMKKVFLEQEFVELFFEYEVFC